MQTRSLRTRLVATTLLLLAVALLVAGAASTITLQHFLRAKLETDLRNTSDVFARFETGPPPDSGAGRGSTGFGSGPRPIDALLVSIDANGAVTSSRLFARDNTVVPTSEYPKLIAVSPGAQPVTVTLAVSGPTCSTARLCPTADARSPGSPRAPR